MKVYNKDEFNINRERLLREIKKGAVFIHPTDTIYGLGCDATNSEAVKKIREIKGRYNQPFSVIAPSKEWIIENCEVPKEGEEWLEKLPGPYTLILKLKNDGAVCPETNPGGCSLGVRIPQHWFSVAVRDLGIPTITTSANPVGKDFMTSMDNLSSDISSAVDFAVYEGEKKASPSTIINLSEAKVDIKKR
jgi:L-threonylcarbamoyladenylate synthase